MADLEPIPYSDAKIRAILERVKTIALDPSSLASFSESVERMTPTELVTNTKMLEKLGIKTNPALRGAYEKALERTAASHPAAAAKSASAVPRRIVGRPRSARG